MLDLAKTMQEIWNKLPPNGADLSNLTLTQRQALQDLGKLLTREPDEQGRPVRGPDELG